MKRFVIGDIHGRFEALREVLKISDFNYDEDKLIVLGDVVDGGFDTKKCVDELLKIKNLVFIRGNHDEWFLQHLSQGFLEEVWIQQGGANTLESYGAVVNQSDFVSDKSEVDLSNFNVPVTHQEFFNNSVFFHIEDNMVFVHGGFKPGVHPKDEEKFNLLWDRELINYALTHNVRPWDKVFIGHSTTQMFANNPHVKDVFRPIQLHNLVMMDTGAGWNGRLCVMDVDGGDYFCSGIQSPAKRELEF